MTDKRGPGFMMGVVAVLAIAGGLAWFLGRAEKPAAAPQANVIEPAATPPEAKLPPPVDLQSEAQPKPLVVNTPDTAAHPPILNGSGRPPPPEDPVVAKGTVVWPGGALPEDVDVTLYDVDGTDLEYATTDAKGAFELRHKDPLLAGWSVGTDELMLMEGKDQHRTLAPALVADLPAHQPGDPPVVMELTIGFAPVLTGRVTDRVTGAPLAKAEVYVASSFAAHALDQTDTVTQQDGSYTLPLEGVPLQGLIVWARADGYQSALIGPQDFAPTANAGEVSRLDFQLDPSAVLKGRVVDAATGLPVEDATVTVGSRFAAFVDESDWEITEQDGSFAIELPEIPVDGAWLLVNAEGYAPAAMYANGPWPFVEIKLQQSITLGGSVADAAGKPVVGAEVRVAFDGDTRELDQGLYDETWTDDKGQFELKLETVPMDGGLLRVESGTHAPFEARLGEVAKVTAGNRYDVKVSLLQP